MGITISHRMREVAIVGAGELGGLVAHALARRNLASAIRLIDANGRVAEGKALDICQAAPIESFTTTVTGSSDLSTAAGAGIIVIADPVTTSGSGPVAPEDGDGLSLLRQLHAIAPRALYVCAGALTVSSSSAVRDAHSTVEHLGPPAKHSPPRPRDRRLSSTCHRAISLAVLRSAGSIVIAWEDAAAWDSH